MGHKQEAFPLVDGILDMLEDHPKPSGFSSSNILKAFENFVHDWRYA
jgi:hypothetical protein